MTDASALARLIRLVDKLEDGAASYVTLAEVQAAVSAEPTVASAVAEAVLLVDYRSRLDGTEVTLCRLNRQHPLVKELTGW